MEPRKKTMSWGSAVWLIPLLGLLLSACERKSSAARLDRDPTAVPIPVTVTPVRAQRVQRTVEMVGTLHPDQEITISSQVEGQVAATEADLGDRVNKGQLLARIRDTEFRLAVEQTDASLKETLARLGLEKVPLPSFDVAKTSPVLKAKAELDAAEANWQRMKTLLEGKFISAQEYDSAEARYKTAQAVIQSTLDEAKAIVANAHMKEAQLRAVREKLKDTTIEAPLAGSVSRRLISAGEYVKAGAPLFTIVQDHPLKLRGMIPERFAPSIQAGQKVELKVDAFPQKTFSGQLTRLSPAAEVASRSFLAEGRIENPERLLKPGFFTKASIFTQVDPNALTVPQQALVNFAGVTKVFVVVNDVAQERVVQAGAQVGGNEVEITSGLKPGELVAISGLSRLTQGTAVKVSGPVMPRELGEERRAPR